jgi:hypothetical protein
MVQIFVLEKAYLYIWLRSKTNLKYIFISANPNMLSYEKVKYFQT